MLELADTIWQGDESALAPLADLLEECDGEYRYTKRAVFRFARRTKGPRITRHLIRVLRAFITILLTTTDARFPNESEVP
jgi:hypothetical protein